MDILNTTIFEMDGYHDGYALLHIYAYGIPADGYDAYMKFVSSNAESDILHWTAEGWEDGYMYLPTDEDGYWSATEDILIQPLIREV